MDGIGDLWNRQDGQTSGFDYAKYNSMPWMIVKTLLAFCIITLAYLLYGLLELPWGLYGSATGILILGFGPFFAGLILGFAFESPRRALAYSLAVGFLALGANFFLMKLPQMLELAEYGPDFMRNVWYYGFFIPFLITICFVPAGTMIAASTNVYE